MSLPFPKRKAEHRVVKRALFGRILSGIIKVNIHHQRIALPIIATISVLGLIGILRIQVETNPVDFSKVTMLCNRLEGLTESFLKAATIEGLTGLHTRDFFVSVLDQEVARARRYKTPLSLLMVGLDNLNEMNRLYGHRAANIILTDTARILKRNVRKTDLICHYNVDQFALILTHTPRKVASALGERIKDLLEAHPFQAASNSMSLTTTLGLTSLDPDSEKGARALIGDALQALSEARGDRGTVKIP